MLELKPRGQPPSGNDPDGIRIVAGDAKTGGRTRVFQILALLLATTCVGYVVAARIGSPRPAPPPDLAARAAAAAFADEVGDAEPAASPPSQSPESSAVIPAAGTPSPRPSTPRRKASQRPSQDPPEEVVDRPEPNESQRQVTGAEYIQALHDAGIYEGIGAFPPPGTKPALEGLAVPPDYQLPEGYVRHHQSTDDGQDIEPILMYSPDYEFFDANGNPLVIPEDRVVRPEYAPPGVPIRKIEIPPPRDSLGALP